MARGRRKPAELASEQERVAAALPGYRLGHPVGVGAYGMVITARHRRLKRDVAIKMIAGEPSETSDFAAEAETLAGFDHPHIVRVFDYVETKGLGLIVMELLTGGTLTGRRKDLSQPQACAVGLAVAAALSHAHAKGVLHRDIKMDNVIFDAHGCPKVADFGIARAFTGTGVTGTAQHGTPMYMPPEQILGGRIGPASDIYALGVLMYRLLSGRPPFETPPPTADSVQSLPHVMQQTLTVAPSSPPGVADTVARVVLRALSKKPEDRQSDADAFARDLAAAAVAVFGPSWLADTGIPVHLADGVREAAEPPPPRPEPPVGEEMRKVSQARWYRAIEWGENVPILILVASIAYVAYVAVNVVVIELWPQSTILPISEIIILLVATSVFSYFNNRPIRTGKIRPRRGLNYEGHQSGTVPVRDSEPATAPSSPVWVLSQFHIAGLAELAARQVEAAGFTVERTRHVHLPTSLVPVSTVVYDDGHRTAAQALMDAIPAIKMIVPRSQIEIDIDLPAWPVGAPQPTRPSDSLILVITSDWPLDDATPSP